MIEGVSARSLTIRIPLHMHALIERQAEAQCETVSTVVRALLRHAIATEIQPGDRATQRRN
jgi:hypothetical protein